MTKKWTTALIVTALALGAVAGCTLPQECYQNSANPLPFEVWDLSTVNGSTLAPPGYPIPQKTDRLRSGSLEFRTTRCIDPEKSKGDVEATYLINNSTGQPKLPSKRYAGTFKYDHSTNTLTISAFGYSQSGTVSGTTFTIGADLSLLGAGTFTLVFHADQTTAIRLAPPTLAP